MGLFSIKCSVCGSLEHSTSDCPHGMFSTECSVCGSKDHATKDCLHGAFSTKCSICGSKNHATKDCPHGAFSTKCSVCGSKDHATKDCPHGAFSTKCSVCGSLNHATKDCPQGGLGNRTSSKHPTESYSSSSGEGGLTEFFGKIIGWLIVAALVIMVAVWLALNLVLPVVLLNSAVILTVLALSFKQHKTLFAVFALVGGSYMLLDIRNGWLSVNFVENVIKDTNWISGFVYINAIAIGISVWFILQPIWSNAKLIKTTNKRKSIFLFIASVLLIIISTISTPVVYHLMNNPFIVRTLNIEMDTKKFEGIYKVPGDETFDEGQLVFKVSNANLVGLCEQRVNPMGGLSKGKYEIMSITSKGEAKYKYSYALYSRWNKLLQENKEASTGILYFMNDRIRIENNTYMKAK